MLFYCTFQTLWRVSVSSCVWYNSVNVMSEIKSAGMNEAQSLQTNMGLGSSGRVVFLTVLLGILLYTTNLVGWNWLKTHDKPWGHLLFSVFLVSSCSCGHPLIGRIYETGKKLSWMDCGEIVLAPAQEKWPKKPSLRLLPYRRVEKKVQRNHDKGNLFLRQPLL